MDNPFTSEIIGWAQAAQRKWQIPTSLILSAAKVESNLGKAVPPGSNNWFGIKTSHGGVKSPTREQTPGGVDYTITAGFMVFAHPADSFMYYGELLGTFAPYRAMVSKFLASNRGPDGVQTLSLALTGVYASDNHYGVILVAVQKTFDLYQYDALPTQVGDSKMTTPVKTSVDTNTLVSVFNTLQGFNWAQLSDILEGKSTFQQGVHSIEELANTLVHNATVLGVPLAGTVETFLPAAEGLINFAINFLPTSKGIQGSVEDAPTTNAPAIRTGR